MTTTYNPYLFKEITDRGYDAHEVLRGATPEQQQMGAVELIALYEEMPFTVRNWTDDQDFHGLPKIKD